MVVDFQNVLRLHWLLDPPKLRAAMKVRRTFDLQERRQELPDGAMQDPALLWSTAPLWHRTPGEFRRGLETLGLRIVAWDSVGFGPFTFMGRPVLSPERSVRLSEAFERAAQKTPWHLLDRLCSTPVLTVECAGPSRS
jgi:hypothetical protein